jgi:hypothetical protein
MRFNHMEITVPLGSLTPEFRDRVEAFYGEVFNFRFRAGELFGHDSLSMEAANGDFILLIEGDVAMSAPGFDHLGFELPSRADVDETLAKVKRFGESDDRVQVKEYADAVMYERLYHAYYVKYLLPIWFDVQYAEPSVAIKR